MVLWQRNPLRRLRVASLNKMMTALITVRSAPPGARVLVTREAVESQGSKVGVLIGAEWDLTYCHFCALNQQLDAVARMVTCDAGLHLEPRITARALRRGYAGWGSNNMCLHFRENDRMKRC